MNNVVSIVTGDTTLAEAPGEGNSPPIDPPGGGGDDGRMEARLSEVEKAIIAISGRLDRIGDRLDTISGSVNEVKGSVSGFKWQVFAAAIAVILAVVATGVSIQQMTVSTFQAAGQAGESKTPGQPTIIVVPGAATPIVQSPSASASR